ncbi:endonuclease I [bacterium]|nr:endonuclease I [bacterium]
MATTSERRRHAIKNGYRSGLEDDIAKDLKDRGVNFEYEKLKVQWQLLENKTYTPDFKLPNGIIIESKGRFIQADRKKHLIIQDQHPFLDIRFVFSNSRSKLYKGAKSTYGDWCNKHGFLYADKRIPDEWLTQS